MLKVRAQKKDITRAKYFRINCHGGRGWEERSQHMPGLILSFDTKSLWQLFKSHIQGTGSSSRLPDGTLGRVSAPYTGHRLVSWSSCTTVCMLCHGLIIRSDMLGQSLHQNQEIILEMYWAGDVLEENHEVDSLPSAKVQKLLLSFKCVSKSAVKSYTFPLFCYNKLYLRM